MAAARTLGYSPQHTKRLIKKARDRELLTEAPRGKAGGVLTDKARALLEQEGAQ